MRDRHVCVHEHLETNFSLNIIIMTFRTYVNNGITVYCIYGSSGALLIQTTSWLIAKRLINLGYLDTSKIPDEVYI